MKELSIVFAASEAVPFSKTGGLADVIGTLSTSLAGLGQRVSVFLPLYRETAQGKHRLKDSEKKLMVSLGNKSVAFSVYTCTYKKVKFYFIKQDEFFNREHLYGTTLGDYADNGFRFAFFTKAILQSIEALRLKPDVIHCHDWQTALLAFYLKNTPVFYSPLAKSKVIFTIHNLMYRGLFNEELLPELGIDKHFYQPEMLEFHGQLSFMKAGLLYSDSITTVSCGYAREILTQEFGFGFEGLLQKRKSHLYGITNGVDYTQWNPAIDSFIAAHYDREDLGNKKICRADLLGEVGLSAGEDVPLLGSVGRLVPNKGIDYIVNAAGVLVENNCRLILLGFGDEYHNALLKRLAKQYPENISVTIGFDEKLAHKIEAGCDIFLMPSRYEPCGLNQLYSLKYGTIPVVGAVGGLNDTIIDYTDNPAQGTGFKFNEFTQVSFERCLQRAIAVYHNKAAWKKLMQRAMKSDFSWERSAKEYVKLYKRKEAKQ